MSAVRAEVVKWGSAPGDSNAMRLTVDVYEIDVENAKAIGLDHKGAIVAIARLANDGSEEGSGGSGMPMSPDRDMQP